MSGTTSNLSPQAPGTDAESRVPVLSLSSLPVELCVEILKSSDIKEIASLSMNASLKSLFVAHSVYPRSDVALHARCLRVDPVS